MMDPNTVAHGPAVSLARLPLGRSIFNSQSPRLRAAGRLSILLHCRGRSPEERRNPQNAMKQPRLQTESGVAMIPRHQSNTVTARATTVALQRLNLLRRYQSHRAAGDTATAAARACGASVPTLWRYERRLAHGGLPALAPQTARCGRKSLAAVSGLSADMIRQVQALALALGSVTRAWKAFAELPVCAPKLARKIRRAKSVPPSLLALAKVHRRTMHARECGGQMIILAGGLK